MTEKRLCNICKRKVVDNDAYTYYQSKRIHTACQPGRHQKRDLFEVVKDLNPDYLIDQIHNFVSVHGTDFSSMMIDIVIMLGDYLIRLFKFHGTPEHKILELPPLFYSQSSHESRLSDYVKILLKKKGENKLTDALKEIVDEKNELRQFLLYEAIVAGNWSRAEYHKSTDSKNINRTMLYYYAPNLLIVYDRL